MVQPWAKRPGHRYPTPSRAEGITHTSPWFNHGRNDHFSDTLPKPSRRHQAYQPMVQPWAKRPCRRLPTPSQAEGIRHTSPWFNPGRNDQATDTQPQAEPKASHIPAHGSTMGETTISPTPYPNRAEGIRHTSPWFNPGRNDQATETNPKPSRRHQAYQPMVQPWAKRPGHRHPTPSQAEGIRHTSPWFNHGRNDHATDTLPQAKPKASHISARGESTGSVPRAKRGDIQYPSPSQAEGITISPRAPVQSHRMDVTRKNPVGPSSGSSKWLSSVKPTGVAWSIGCQGWSSRYTR
jgi:hypothetical protein